MLVSYFLYFGCYFFLFYFFFFSLTWAFISNNLKLHNLAIEFFSIIHQGHWAWEVSVQFSCSVVSDSLGPHEPQHATNPCISERSSKVETWNGKSMNLRRKRGEDHKATTTLFPHYKTALRQVVIFREKTVYGPCSTKSESSWIPCKKYTVVVVIQSLNCFQIFETPWTAASQTFLSFTISQSMLKLMSIESLMPSNHLALVVPLSSCFNLS